MTRENKVAEFMKAGEIPSFEDEPNKVYLILRGIDEEYAEFDEAAFAYQEDPNEDTRKQLVKEWADLQYVVSQAAVYFEIPADPAFNRVHNNNMTKVIDGKLIKREDGKVLKPEGYVPADMSGL